MNQYRTETDALGSVQVPKNAYYGAYTLRGQLYYPLTGQSLHPLQIQSLAQIKKAAANCNFRCGLLLEEVKDAINSAANEILADQMMDQFLVDAFQGNSGFPSNQNMNEVLANRGGEILGDPLGSYEKISLKDVNLNQYAPDVFLTAGKITVLKLFVGLENESKRLIQFMEDGGENYSHFIPQIVGLLDTLESFKESVSSVFLGELPVSLSEEVKAQYEESIIPELSKITRFSLQNGKSLDVQPLIDVSDYMVTVSQTLAEIGKSLLASPQQMRYGGILEILPQLAYDIAGKHQSCLALAKDSTALPMALVNLFASIETMTNGIATFRVNYIGNNPTK